MYSSRLCAVSPRVHLLVAAFFVSAITLLPFRVARAHISQGEALRFSPASAQDPAPTPPAPSQAPAAPAAGAQSPNAQSPNDSSKSTSPSSSSDASSSSKGKRPSHAHDFLIRGTVFQPNGKAFPELKLRIRREAEKKFRWETFTNSRGEFAVRVPQGLQYELVVNAKGFVEQARQVDARSGITEDNVAFRLEPAGGKKK